jgi:hypothetical protein
LLLTARIVIYKIPVALNKKSAQKQKRLKETTASRKPLFHEKPSPKFFPKTAKTKPKTSPLPAKSGLYFCRNMA